MLKINLRPREYRPPKQKRAIKVGFRGPIFILIAAVLVMAYFSWTQMQKAAELQNKIEELDAKRAQIQDKLNMIKKIEGATASIEKNVKYVSYLNTYQNRWLNLLNTINEAVPDGLWLTHVQERTLTVHISDQKPKVEEGEESAARLKTREDPGAPKAATTETKPGLSITGRTTDIYIVNEMIKKLEESGYFTDFNLELSEPEQYERWFFNEFTIVCTYNNDVLPAIQISGIASPKAKEPLKVQIRK